MRSSNCVPHQSQLSSKKTNILISLPMIFVLILGSPIASVNTWPVLNAFHGKIVALLKKNTHMHTNLIGLSVQRFSGHLLAWLDVVWSDIAVAYQLFLISDSSMTGPTLNHQDNRESLLDIGQSYHQQWLDLSSQAMSLNREQFLITGITDPTLSPSPLWSLRMKTMFQLRRWNLPTIRSTRVSRWKKTSGSQHGSDILFLHMQIGMLRRILLLELIHITFTVWTNPISILTLVTSDLICRTELLRLSI